MSFNEQLPKWENQGSEPPQTKQDEEGWQPQEKPPSSWFNWLHNRTYECLKELRNFFTNHKNDGVEPHFYEDTVDGTKYKLVVEDGEFYLEVIE